MPRSIEEILAPKPEARPRIYAYSIDADFPVACTYQPHMTLAKSNAVAIVLARATMRPMLSAIRELVSLDDGLICVTDHIYPPLAALRVHYDRIRPDWRTK